MHNVPKTTKRERRALNHKEPREFLLEVLKMAATYSPTTAVPSRWPMICHLSWPVTMNMCSRDKDNRLYNDFTEDILSDFYKHFDKTFLGLFPNFIEELNALLIPEGRFTCKNNELSTPLRICALIRLDITNLEDIARFLRVSVKTVFNYRSTIRNNAKYDRNKIEEQIAHL